MKDKIPQVADIVKVKGSGEITIKKDLRAFFGTDKNDLYVTIGDEVILSNRRTSGATKVSLVKNRISLEGVVSDVLGLEKGSHVAFVQRGDDLALKKLIIEDWRDGVEPEILDRETPYAISRSAVRIYWPEEGLPILGDRCKNLRLKHDVREYLAGRESIWAWRARRLLNAPDDNDTAVCRALVTERTDGQHDNGSWDNSLVLTAKNLRELIELGVRRNASAVKKAAEWLLARPESAHKPGAFFLHDRLVEELASCVEKRKTGSGKSFRDRTKPDEKIAAGDADDMFGRACGPRFVWPNAVAVEALTMAGYGAHPRVRAAVTAAVGSSWCECGVSYDGKPEAPPPETLEQWLDHVILRFRLSGLNTLEELGILALSRKCDFQTRRVSHRREGDVDIYEIAPKHEHEGPCGVVLARCFSCVDDETARKWVQHLLWTHAPGANPRFRSDQRQVCPAATDLDTCARYDYPVTRMRIMIAVPALVETQNKDGSWGMDTHADMATFAVVAALLKVRDLLPQEMIPK